MSPLRAQQNALLRWGERTRRDLPWRSTRDPWAILVSELMLQQTQVARVVPKYLAFLQRFPDAPTCAAGGVGAVIELWAGLGYNRRAVNLHRTAVQVTEEHSGVLPATLPELLDLPGIGPYTARAVLVFAHEADVGVVDTNVGRLLARWQGSGLKPKEAQALADRLVPAGRAWEWNQALFDLGAGVCSARTPQCDDCPVHKWCAWQGSGPDPAAKTFATGSKQSKFAGSDRQGRGRLVDALRRGPVSVVQLPEVMGWADDHDRAHRVALTLVTDGLAIQINDELSLP